jgi:hypothetical protein
MIPGLQARAIAAGRQFSAAIGTDGTLWTWGANHAGQLGDGTLARRVRPVAVRGLDAAVAVALGAAHAVAVNAGGDVRTWGEGASGRLSSGSVTDQQAPVEIISAVPDWGRAPGDDPVPADVTPPTIVATTSPPLSDGWMDTSVTVSFACADDLELATCSGPVTVSADGTHRVTGTAVDRAGNAASATVVLSIDRLPPAFSVASPVDGASTPEESVTVAGLVVDAGAGVADVRCNGAQVAVIDGRISCTVALRPGRNDIILRATDVVGHSISTAILMTRIGTSTALTLTPATRRAVAGEIMPFSLLDDFGATVDGAFWSSSDASVVALTADDPPVITAAGIGTAIVRAEKDGLISEASVTVVPAMIAGETRWTLPATPRLVAEPPLFANRVAPDVPHLFAIESQEWGQALVRAVSSDGEVLWQQHVPGVVSPVK